MGTDELGRDTFSRIVFGARVSLQVGIISVFIALLIGAVFGITAGFLQGRTDAWLMHGSISCSPSRGWCWPSSSPVCSAPAAPMP